MMKRTAKGDADSVQNICRILKQNPQTNNFMAHVYHLKKFDEQCFSSNYGPCQIPSARSSVPYDSFQN